MQRLRRYQFSATNWETIEVLASNQKAAREIARQMWALDTLPQNVTIVSTTN